jgi:hypothetical protein
MGKEGLAGEPRQRSEPDNGQDREANPQAKQAADAPIIHTGPVAGRSPGRSRSLKSKIEDPKAKIH